MIDGPGQKDCKTWAELLQEAAKAHNDVYSNVSWPAPMEALPPNKPATRAEIASVQNRRRISFERSYVEFLLHANGWPGFSFFDFYSTDQLAQRDDNEDFFMHELSQYVEYLGIRRRDMCIIAGSDATIARIFHSSTTGKNFPGWFFWWDRAEEQARFSTFKEMFIYMTAQLPEMERLLKQAYVNGSKVYVRGSKLD